MISNVTLKITNTKLNYWHIWSSKCVTLMAKVFFLLEKSLSLLFYQIKGCTPFFSPPDSSGTDLKRVNTVQISQSELCLATNVLMNELSGFVFVDINRWIEESKVFCSPSLNHHRKAFEKFWPVFLLQICNQIGKIDRIGVESWPFFLLFSPCFEHQTQRLQDFLPFIDSSSYWPIESHIGVFGKFHMTHCVEQRDQLLGICRSSVKIKSWRPLYVCEFFYKFAQNRAQTFRNGPPIK